MKRKKGKRFAGGDPMEDPFVAGTEPRKPHFYKEIREFIFIKKSQSYP